MKFILLAAIAAVASTMRVSRGDQAHKTIFEGCSVDSDCADGKYCLTKGGAWNYCKEWCYLGGVKVQCSWLIVSHHSFKIFFLYFLKFGQVIFFLIFWEKGGQALILWTFIQSINFMLNADSNHPQFMIKKVVKT